MMSSVILIASVAGVLMYFKPHRSVRNEKAAFSLSVAELVNAFMTNESQANEAFVGKVVEVQGVLKEMILNDSTLVLLMGDSTQTTGVSCYLQREERSKYKSLTRGQTVVVKGVCNGMLLDVVLDKALLVNNEKDISTH